MALAYNNIIVLSDECASYGLRIYICLDSVRQKKNLNGENLVLVLFEFAKFGKTNKINIKFELIQNAIAKYSAPDKEKKNHIKEIFRQIV